MITTDPATETAPVVVVYAAERPLKPDVEFSPGEPPTAPYHSTVPPRPYSFVPRAPPRAPPPPAPPPPPSVLAAGVASKEYLEKAFIPF